MSERERFSVIETGSSRKRSLEERLKDQPEFKAFLGLWSEDEAASFDASIKAQRKIDEELWS